MCGGNRLLTNYAGGVCPLHNKAEVGISEVGVEVGDRSHSVIYRIFGFAVARLDGVGTHSVSSVLVELDPSGRLLTIHSTGKCYAREGVNHLEKCGKYRGKPSPSLQRPSVPASLPPSS